MAFGPSKKEKEATQKLEAIGSTATGNSAEVMEQGRNLFNIGGSTTGQGLDFFRTLLSGNRANTSAMLQPNIQQGNQMLQEQLRQLTTLMPRGGGRTAALFGAPIQATGNVMDLFSGVRSGAANQMIDTGLQQSNLAAGLYGVSNSALNTGAGVSNNLFQNAFDQRRASNALWNDLGQGLFGLATTPFGGSNRSILNRL